MTELVHLLNNHPARVIFSNNCPSKIKEAYSIYHYAYEKR